MSVTATVALWVNVLAFGFEPSAAAYAVALTALLVVGGAVFVTNLDLFFT